MAAYSEISLVKIQLQ